MERIRTGKQIKRDFKKYLDNTGVQFISKTGYIQIGGFYLTFYSDDGYIDVRNPSNANGLLSISFPYIDAHSTLVKLVKYHFNIFHRGIHIKGKLRVVKQGKTKEILQ